MIHLLLAIIYLAFISLGLPDALLGSAWTTTDLSLCHSFYPGTFRSREFPSRYRCADGKCLCGNDFDAAFVWSAGQMGEYSLISGVFAGGSDGNVFDA